MLPKPVLYYGKDEAPPTRVPLRAGPLTLLYENGDLRYIRLGDQELVRRIYVAVRDQNWDTILPQLHDVQMNISDDSFQISYAVENRQSEIDFAWRGTITGARDGTIRFAMDGAAHSTFLRNRIGFCVLHPLACAGTSARITHADGTVDEQRFPELIAPQLVINGEIKPVIPFNEMRALAHEVQPGVWAAVQFEGEIFELEDQRNWTDASYKTYGTPLRLPFPAKIEAGTPVVQSITLTLRSEQPLTTTGSSAAQPTVTIGTAASPLPALGVGMAGHGHALGSAEVERLRALHLSHLRVDLHLAEAEAVATLQRAVDEAKALGVQLEVALHLTDAERELRSLRTTVQALNPPLKHWLIFKNGEKSTRAQWVTLARTILGDVANVPFGAGTNVYFTELNRERPPIEVLDLVAYSLNPQVHAFDNSSLAETLATQAVTVNSARQFSGALPIIVSPVTLQPRFNPNATGPAAPLAPDELPPQVDVRQMSLFGAGWTLGSIKYLAEGGAASVTYYETTGWRGLMETAAGSPLPGQFRSLPGGVFPLYHVFAAVGEFAGGEVIQTHASTPLTVEALTLQQAGRRRTLVANLTETPQTIQVAGLSAQVRVRQLDENNVEQAMQAPAHYQAAAGTVESTGDGVLELALLPFAIATLDHL